MPHAREHLPTLIAGSIVAVAAFVAGVTAAPLLSTANAQATPAIALQPQIIDVDALDGATIGPILPGTELRSKPLVMTENALVVVQQGNTPKHFHTSNDAVQYVIAGTGTIWLGDQQRQIKPGDLIVIPKGTPHAGTVATSGTFKAIAIKIPPQAAGDVHLVP